MSAASDFRAAARFMAGGDGDAERALAVHHSDPPARRCASCGNRWPCCLAQLAEHAIRIRERHDRLIAVLAARAVSPVAPDERRARPESAGTAGRPAAATPGARKGRVA